MKKHKKTIFCDVDGTIAEFKKGTYPKDLAFTKENIELIRRVYKKDFDLFGYD